jgi:shikimate kinase
MKTRHVSDLSGIELSAAFSIAVKMAVARAKAAGQEIPTFPIKVEAVSASHNAKSMTTDVLEQGVQGTFQSVERTVLEENSKIRKNRRRAA